MERRLAAVLIADVVGYGRLSQIDEEGTRARFQADLKQIFESKIAAYRGRLIKTMGDGLLVEFPSVVDALRCAVEVQQEKAKRNAAAPPEQRLLFRIGVNLGDVIVEGDDIHGDGVNIADRIQALAEPGGVAISGTAYDHVKAKLPVGYVSLGEQKVKSIAEPVRVYRVAMDPAAAGKTVGAPRRLSNWRIPAAVALVALPLVGAGAWWQPWKQATGPNLPDMQPSLVVLPFDDLSSDAEQGYLADGITENLTTELARIPGLFVISRNAAFAFKGKEVRPAQIADELGVRYILEGSVRRAGDNMRINAQLIDGHSAGHVWAERFDGAWKDVLTMQDDVVKKVVAALELELVSDQPDEQAGGRTSDAPGGTSVPAAYDAYLQGLEHERRRTPEDWSAAARFYQEAVALDPDFGRAWAKLAGVYSANYGSDIIEKALGTSNFDMIPKARQYLEQAKKHPSGTYFSVLADLLLFAEGNSDGAIEAAERGIRLDPSDPDTYEVLSLALSFNGRAADASNYIDMAMRVDPGWTPYRHYLAGLAHFCQNRVEDAVAALTKVEALETTSLGSDRLYLLTAAEAHLNDVEAAATYHQELDALKQAVDGIPVTGLSARTNFPFKVAADTDRLIEGLRRAGVPDVPFGYDWSSTDRLYGEEIRSLLFGHQTLGILVETGDAYTRTTSASGAVNVTNGPWSDHGFSQIEADAICTWVTTRGRYCSTIFRNPGGTFEKKNEYVWINFFNHFEFSVVK